MITESRDEKPALRASLYLLASSYAPNYGMIDSRARTFFSFDDGKHTQSLFDLAADPHGDHNLLTPDIAKSEDQAIHNHIAQISRLIISVTSRQPSWMADALAESRFANRERFAIENNRSHRRSRAFALCRFAKGHAQ